MKKKNKILLGILVLMIAALGFLTQTAIKKTKNEVVEEAGLSLNREMQQTELVFHDVSYPLKKRIDTFLLVGTDTDRENVNENIELFYNHIQADVIVLFVIDNEKQEVSAIQINRDTMMDDPWLDVIGNYGGTCFEQIALSYNSGSGGLDSCQNTKRAVSSLLFDAPIDYCLAFSMNGINTLNDLVGGVTVDIVDDLTPVDASLVQGARVTLRGNQAENYIRARMALKDDTNTSRMRRHREYFDGFMVSAKECIASDSKFVFKAIDKLNPYMVTDMSAEIMSEFVSKIDRYGVSSIQYAKGELKKGQYYEFYVDEDDLWEIVHKAYCKQ